MNQTQLFAMLQTLLAMFNVPASAIPAIQPTPQPGTPVAPEWPKMVYHRGVTFLLHAPLDADYQPSVEQIALGSQPGTYVSEPSNAVDRNGKRIGFADGELGSLRSPGGFPLQYGLEPGPNGGTVLSRRIPPRVLHNGVTFADDAEVNAYIAARAARGH